MSDKIYAQVILNTTKIYSESYDKAAAVEAVKIDDKRREAEILAQPDNIYAGISFVDCSKFYRKTLEQSAKEAAIESGFPSFDMPAYLALQYTWNDIIYWAESVLGLKTKVDD